MLNLFIDKEMPDWCIASKIAAYLNTDTFVYIFYDLDEDTDCEAHTYKEGHAIYIWLHKNSPLTLAHELIHVRQLLEGRPLEEDEAYNNEEELCSRLFTKTEKESSL